MDILGFETIENIPAVYHPGMDLLVVSDLHLGLEGSMTHDGNYIPKIQLEQMKNDIQDAKKETEASRILVNGDIKNDFSRSRYSEDREINEFLELLEENFEEKILIKGNHDRFLEQTLKEYSLEPKEFHLEQGVLFTHGHLATENIEGKEFETLIIGHEHPALVLEDEIGIREKVNCFLYGKTTTDKNIIVLPSFSSISNGTNINETPQKELLSPVLRDLVDKEKMKALAVSREAGIFQFPEIGRI